MKNKEKIHLSHLPESCVSVLKHSLTTYLNLECSPDAQAADLLITTDQEYVAENAARPILVLERNIPIKLQTILRQSQQMIDDPALFIDEIRLAQAKFLPSERKIILSDGAEIECTDKEANILLLLLHRYPNPVPRHEMLHRIWRYQPDTETHTVETHIYRLRQKLDQYAVLKDRLQTDDKGYRFIRD